MSGQYPPPNPAHPFTRAPIHQRPSAQGLMPPWGQPSGMNVVSSSMNFYGSPHMGLPSRGGQPWLPPQTHPKPPDPHHPPVAANPLFGLQMMMAPEGNQRIPSEYQQEETMDLSSHSSTPAVPDVPKIVSARTDNSDMLRNGTILPVEVNGDVDMTETDVKDSIMTSVIATNPLRESATDALNCSRMAENSVVKRTDIILPESLMKSMASTVNPPLTSVISESAGDKDVIKAVDNVVSSVLKPTSDELVDRGAPASSNRLGNPSDILVDETDQGKEQSLDELSKSVEDLDNTLHSVDSMNPAESQSFHGTSSLSVDTDDSKLVVAESSADDIFGMSPVDDIDAPSSEETDKFEKSNETSQANTGMVQEKPLKSSLESAAFSDHWAPVPPTMSEVQQPVKDAEPHPSVENVETLLESMFNSQEETSCSSQNSNTGVPQSVIVSNGAKIPIEVHRQPVDKITPMKEEDLAMTLAEDIPVMAEVKEEVKEVKDTEDLMDEIEKKLEMLTESSSSQLLHKNEQDKIESSVPEPVKDNKVTDLAQEGNKSPTLLKVKNEEDQPLQPITNENIKSSIPKVQAGTSNNPFIEVETELEKMFAGIVEPTDEIGSDNQSQPSVSEPKRPVTSKRSIPKRKKANSRRPSDTSVFGGSSGDSTPLKKKGRKRMNDSGSERSTKKMKMDSVDSIKKGRVSKDISSDNVIGKVKGPFVHIEGSKESPASVVVVNSGSRADDDDGLDKASTRRKHSTLQRGEGSRRTGPAYNSSTLSMRYNSDTADLTWVCVFCKRGPHCAGGFGGQPAGDLFGPYRIPATPPVDDAMPPGTPADKDVVEEQKKRGGKHPKSLRASGAAEHFIQKMAKKNKRSASTEVSEAQPGLLSVEGGCEVWLHGPCAEWAPGLCLVATQLVGLDDAVWTALRTRCSQCGETGAGIGCVVSNCAARVHYHCALVSGWLLDADTFIARCTAHRTRLRPG